MRRLSATQAARQFSDLLDSVEASGETVVIERRGKAVASIAPAPASSGKDLKRLLAERGEDDGWPLELRELRESISGQDRSWPA